MSPARPRAGSVGPGVALGGTTRWDTLVTRAPRPSAGSLLCSRPADLGGGGGVLGRPRWDQCPADGVGGSQEQRRPVSPLLQGATTSACTRWPGGLRGAVSHRLSPAPKGLEWGRKCCPDSMQRQAGRLGGKGTGLGTGRPQAGSRPAPAQLRAAPRGPSPLGASLRPRSTWGGRCPGSRPRAERAASRPRPRLGLRGALGEAAGPGRGARPPAGLGGGQDDSAGRAVGLGGISGGWGSRMCSA